MRSGTQLLTLVLLCVVGGHLCTGEHQRDDDDQLLSDLDRLLSANRDNIHVIQSLQGLRRAGGGPGVRTPHRRPRALVVIVSGAPRISFWGYKFHHIAGCRT